APRARLPDPGPRGPARSRPAARTAYHHLRNAGSFRHGTRQGAWGPRVPPAPVQRGAARGGGPALPRGRGPPSATSLPLTAGTPRRSVVVERPPAAIRQSRFGTKNGERRTTRRSASVFSVRRPEGAAHYALLSAGRTPVRPGSAAPRTTPR